MVSAAIQSNHSGARESADTVRFEAISRPDHEVEVISAYDGLELEL